MTPASDRVVSALIIRTSTFFILVAVFSLELTFAIGDSVDEDDRCPPSSRNMMRSSASFEGATMAAGSAATDSELHRRERGDR